VLVAVEDHSGAIVNPDSIDPDALAAYVAREGRLQGFSGGEPVDHETFFSTSADMFIPAALENQVTAETAPLLNVSMVVEGANGPTNIEGDKILQEKGILVLPDVLCNAGGVIVSYFEWLQNKRSEFWDLEEVDAKLRKQILGAYRRVRDAARTYNTDPGAAGEGVQGTGHLPVERGAVSDQLRKRKAVLGEQQAARNREHAGECRDVL